MMKKGILKYITIIAVMFFVTAQTGQCSFQVTDKSGNKLGSEIYSDNTQFFASYNPQNLIIKKYVKNKEQTKILNDNGKYLFDGKYDYITDLTSKLYIAEKNKKTYVINDRGGIVLTLNKTSQIEKINDELFSVKDFGLNSSSVSGNVKSGFLAIHPGNIYNNNLKKIYTGDITRTQNLGSGYTYVKINDEDGIIIDKSGNTLLSGVKYCSDNKQGVVFVKTASKQGLFNLRKKYWEYDANFSGIPEIGEDFKIITLSSKGDDLQYLADDKFKPYKPQNGYYYIVPSDGVFLASSNAVFTNTVLNKKSKILYRADKREEIKAANSKFVVILHNGKMSLKNIKGRELLKNTYDSIMLSGNSILTKNGENFELLNSKLKPVTKFTAESATVDDRIITAADKDGFKLFDSETGKIILTTPELKTYSGKLYIIEKNGKKGIINSKNETVIPFEYDDITPVTYTAPEKEEQKFALKKGAMWCITDAERKSTTGFVYNQRPEISFDNFTVLKN